MGADLSIRSIREACEARYKPAFDAAISARDALPKDAPEEERKKAQDAVWDTYDKLYSEGYFRDSYNGTSVLNAIGLSWWQDIIPLCRKKDGKLGPSGINRFLSLLEAHPVPEITKSFLRAHYCEISENETVADWQLYFEEKRRDLIKFLRLARSLGEPIIASL